MRFVSAQLIARLDPAATARLLDALPGPAPFHVWDDPFDCCRWMCAWDTTPADVDGFASAVAAAVSR